MSRKAQPLIHAAGRRGKCFVNSGAGIMSLDEYVVFIIDDDPSMRRSLESLIRSVGLKPQSFETTQDFLLAERPEAPCCLVLDVRLPGRSGLEFQRELIKSGIRLPVIFIT